MKKLSLIFLNLIIVFVISCQNEKENNKEVVVEEKIPQPFDTLAYLERHNTDDIIYKGTESFMEVINSNNFIETETIIDADYLRFDKVKAGFDSLFFVLNSDTLYLSYLKFLKGRDGPVKYLSHLEFSKSNAKVISQEITNGYVYIEGQDTTIGTDGASSAGIFEFKHKIPFSKLKNVEHLYFRGEEIEFRK